MSLETQIEAALTDALAAILAQRRGDCDRLIELRRVLPKTRVRADAHLGDDLSTNGSRKDYVMAHLSDLLDIALWAWYALENDRSPSNKQGEMPAPSEQGDKPVA